MMSALWSRVAMVLGCLLVVAILFALFFRGNAAVANSQAKQARQQAKNATEQLAQANKIIETERKQLDKVNQLADRFEKDKQRAETEANRLRADLRNGTVRLRDTWTSCPAVPEGDTATGKPDAGTADRAESASRIIGAAAEADATIRALQDYVREVVGGSE